MSIAIYIEALRQIGTLPEGFDMESARELFSPGCFRKD